MSALSINTGCLNRRFRRGMKDGSSGDVSSGSSRHFRSELLLFGTELLTSRSDRNDRLASDYDRTHILKTGYDSRQYTTVLKTMLARSGGSMSYLTQPAHALVDDILGGAQCPTLFEQLVSAEALRSR